MIGSLKGRVQFIEDDCLVLDCGGVGYELRPTAAVLQQAEEAGSAEMDVVVHTLVRQEEISLFAFASRDERSLFRLLMEASGVGPRIASLIVSQLGQEGFVEAVLTGNPVPLTRTKGVGRKTADRIILELKDKVSKLYAGGGRKATLSQKRMNSAMLEAQEALLGLGYRRQEISDALAMLADQRDAPVDTLIREALVRMRMRK